MRIKFSFLEKEQVGIGISMILYETSIKVEEFPGFADLLAKIEEPVLLKLGGNPEDARADNAYSMDLIVRKKGQLGLPMPGDNYTLLITGNTIKRIERAFYLEID